MKIVQLVRPALDPRRNLALQVREAQAGLADFALSVAEPSSGWLSIELLPHEPAVATPRSRHVRRTG